MALQFPVLFLCLCIFATCEGIANSTDSNSSDSVTPTTTSLSDTTEFDHELYNERLKNQTKTIENALKKYLKLGIKNILPTLMSDSSTVSISKECTQGIMKYLAALTSVKVWAVKMLDATSKPPSGFLDGTLSDFGAFDSCLEIEVPKRNGDLEFRGQYCAIEVWPRLPPTPRNFSIAKQAYAGPLDTIGTEIKIAGSALHYIKPRFGVCIPSTCSEEDMRKMAKRATEMIKADIKIPKCYVTEGVRLDAIHIVVIAFLILLVLSCIAGTSIEYRISKEIPTKHSTLEKVLKCFSLMSNYNRLMSASGGPGELRALNGIRALTMAWVIVGHNYGWLNFDLLRRPKQVISWFHDFEFQTVTNAWVSVDTFFFLSGFLTCYGVLTILNKTKGRLSIPMYIVRRYIRLTPSLLLVMGLAFFMPLITSGPFFYERIDRELESCRQNWWMSLLYISNWFGMRNICVHTTWYLSADFQLYIFAIGFLFALYRSPKLGFALITCAVIVCNVLIGIVTYQRQLPPTILIASGNPGQIEETVSFIYMATYSHVASYFIGIISGYLMLKYKNVKLSRRWTCAGWCCSSFLCLVSLYGLYQWCVGEGHGPLLTSLFAALHRTLFIAGVAWVVLACATGHGGWVNTFLSSPVWAPFSRLCFIVYLLHGLVMWVRLATARERFVFTHYNMIYEFIANTVTTIVLSVPVYLLVEAPLGNLERLCFSKAPQGEKSHLTENVLHFDQKKKGEDVSSANSPVVKLTAVKSLDLVQSTAVMVDANIGKVE